ncbi:MAG TPA: YkvA family protein [Rhizomicrobium sp.]|nr:YkvA family protein [Rhizomicrobium sp.]
MDLSEPSTIHLPATIAQNARTVEEGFWKKLLKLAGRIPFADDAAAAYFCAVDPATPGRVRGVLLAALAYFVTPIDAIPDFIAGLGFTDDAAVLAMALGLVSRHVTPEHVARARATLGLPK